MLLRWHAAITRCSGHVGVFAFRLPWSVCPFAKVARTCRRSQEPLLALYRARVLAWHGVHPTAAPTRHTILLVRKEGKRSIANFGAVEEFVKRRYGAQATSLISKLLTRRLLLARCTLLT